ncbi:Lrp/AsnC family transcriptional regulator [Quadrisphaera sp. DSM 44207]|uniref:Lrp/AsnC family transcriptional regulator n=1 Tax=Quadrisphaera sp. DSM 44207 TaxID=1881057 RepID=UPI00089146B8|nr:Lrp/AsnC family transcriptional regulator [Quadrisphaera sp. DSM 44207]SDQ03944.1 transcriptional regulator, AsnC family [Quadrisphaera sp. DSM 44207]
MSNRRPDPVDERILRLLVRNARASWREIGDEVGLSANAVAQRVRRLELDGWVRGYTTLLDPALSGPVSTALVQLSTATHVLNSEFEEALAAVPAVVEVLDLAGPVDYQVRVLYSTSRELYEVVNALRALPGVTAIETRPVLREVLSRR